MTFLSLFSGIGAFDLGLERSGMRCVGQVEIDKFCQKILAKHWPHVPRFEDVTTFQGNEIERPDLICGGFPCQDISNAGARAGISGERSGLWSEFHRIIRTIRPGWVIVENVAALLGRGLDVVLGDLAEIGYDAEWHCIPAAAVGAPHLRDRVWIVAYPERIGSINEFRTTKERGRADEAEQTRLGGVDVSDAAPDGRNQKRTDSDGMHEASGSQWAGKSVRSIARTTATISHPELPRLERARLRRAIADVPEWLPEPDICRVVNGSTGIMDRIAALGNALVPQIPEIIGRMIMEIELA